MYQGETILCWKGHCLFLFITCYNYAHVYYTDVTNIAYIQITYTLMHSSS